MRAQKAVSAATGLVAGFALLAASFLATSLFVSRPDGSAQAATPIFAGNPAVPCETSPIVWHNSKPLGQPFKHGRLFQGVQLPADGDDFFTWDFPLELSPNAGWRRWGVDGTIRITLKVLCGFHLAHPEAPRIGIGDIARPGGGFFGKDVGGGLGHASHQNGIDLDVLYPRLDGVEEPADRIAQIDEFYSQDLVDRFVAAGAQYIFVGPKIGLTGPKKIVQGLVFHDDEMHVRFPVAVVTRTPPPPQTAPAPYVASP
jgi:murein endopeptidase